MGALGHARRWRERQPEGQITTTAKCNLGHPSKSNDAGTRDRDARHILRHTLDKMDLKTGVSPEQQVAALLDSSGTLHSDTFVNSNPLPHAGCATRVKMGGDTKRLLGRVQALHGDGEQPKGEAPAASHIHTHLGGIGGTLQQVPPEETLPTYDKDDLLKDIGCIKKYKRRSVHGTQNGSLCVSTMPNTAQCPFHSKTWNEETND